MNTLEVRSVATLQAADHVCIWDKTRWPFRYTHHGIVYTPGATADEIEIAHVWSPINGFRESQADSSFRLTSLTEFLNARPLSDMRRVQYNWSFMADAIATMGEVHRSRSDPPPVVLARCNFLMGLGKGHFSILSLNCEHVALWCKTGVMWSKQLYHRAHGRSSKAAPFLPASKKASSSLLASLTTTLERLRADCALQNQAFAALHGKRVYLQLSATKFVKRFGPLLYVVHNDPKESDLAFRQTPTAFQLSVHVYAYNCVLVTLMDPATNEFVAAKANCVKLLQRRPYHRDSMFSFEYTWGHELQSRRHRRWFLGAQTRDGLLRTVNTRDRAATFEIVDADLVDKESVGIDTDSTRVAASMADDEDTVVKSLPDAESDSSERPQTGMHSKVMETVSLAAIKPSIS